MFRKKCPECKDFNTNRVMLDDLTMGIDEVRLCVECGAEFVNSLQVVEKEVTE